MSGWALAWTRDQPPPLYNLSLTGKESLSRRPRELGTLSSSHQPAGCSPFIGILSTSLVTFWYPRAVTTEGEILTQNLILSISSRVMLSPVRS